MTILMPAIRSQLIKGNQPIAVHSFADLKQSGGRSPVLFYTALGYGSKTDIFKHCVGGIIGQVVQKCLRGRNVLEYVQDSGGINGLVRTFQQWRRLLWSSPQRMHRSDK